MATLNYEEVKDFFYEKLTHDRQGRGRLESAIFHTVVFVYQRGCAREDELLKEIERLEEKLAARAALAEEEVTL